LARAAACGWVLLVVVGVPKHTRSIGSVGDLNLRSTFKQFIFYIANRGVWFGLGLAMAATFEQTLRNGDPIWSSVYGFPIFHHVWVAFIILAVSLLISQWNEAKKAE
jgi:hypothetical protein